MEQLQSENARLLTEYRAEKKRREVAEQTLVEIEGRLAESEKKLAREFQNAGRLSSLPNLPIDRQASPLSGSLPQFPSSDPNSLTQPDENGYRWKRRPR